MNTGDLVRCFYEEIWNCGNKAKIPELLRESFTFRGSLGALDLFAHTAQLIAQFLPLRD
jgi:hypothetical protein